MSKDALQVPDVHTLPMAPDFMPDSDAGREQVGFKDIILPRLTLCQNNTAARDKLSKEYIKGLEEGLFFNSLSKQIYGESLQIVPLFFYHSRIMFKDMKEGGGMLCQAPDGLKCQMNAGGPCLHSEWGPKGEPPECSEFFNYPCLIYRGEGKLTTDEIIIVSMKTTGLKAGRTLNSMMRIRQKASYAGVYLINSVPDTNKAGINYYTWEAHNGTPPWVDKDIYDRAERQYKIVAEGLKKGSITVDDSDDAFADRDTEV